MGSHGGAFDEASAKLQSLERQGSLYNLTLDEVQNQLGGHEKPLGSMNLDELLKSVWTTQVNGVGGAGSSLNPQGSLTLSRDLSKKTVDEVWKDIQQKKKDTSDHRQDRNAQQREPTLGEMTLEDFLANAGVVAELPDNALSDPITGPPQQHNSEQWMQYQLPSAQQPSHRQNMMAVFMQSHPIQQSIPVLDAAYSDTQMNSSPSSLVGTLSDTQTLGRKRVAPGGDVAEKTVERRQKRMIKNRESAARSRARKQAYTQELEIKVSHLEEENERLRRQREMEKALPSAPPPEPKCQLRRSSSASF